MPLVSKNFSDIITFTRASTATYFDSAGVLQTAAIDAPRFDYNPSTLAAQGLLIEEQRTNSIRNNTMQGAVAGTPGTLPTNWGAASIGLTRTIVGTGIENGITYVDVRFNGTTTGQFGSVTFELNNNVAASSGQTWASSAYLKLVAGSLANIGEVGVVAYYWTSTPTFISVTATSASVSSTLTRFFNAGTAPATTGFIQPGLYFNTTAASGQAVDFTLRIGLPQLELGAFATSVIPTTTTALTRSADVASVNTLSPWFNSTAGTIYAEAVTFDSLSGASPAATTFSDGTTNNRTGIVRNNGTGNARMSIVSGGVAQAAADATAWTLNATTKIALAFSTNDFAIVANGGAATTDTSGTVPTVTQLRLASDWGGAGQFLNGWLRRATYYPRRLSNAELQAITV